MEIRHIQYTDILTAGNSAELLDEYSCECSIPEIGHTCPQAQMYNRMETSGLMHCFGAFDGNLLIGFAAILIYVLPHYGVKVASVESLFVSKDHRPSGMGIALIKCIEQDAKSNGCTAILYSAPVSSQLEKVLSMRKQYRRTNAVFTRKLQ